MAKKKCCYGGYCDYQEVVKRAQKVSESTESSGYAKCYDKHNDELCSAIGTITELKTTQRPITSEEYERLKIILETMRDILFSLKA